MNGLEKLLNMLMGRSELQSMGVTPDQVDQGRLLQMLKKSGTPTYSDTPGMGNLVPHQMLNSAIPQRWDTTEYKWQMPPRLFPQRSFHDQRELEALLLNHYMQNWQTSNRHYKQRGPDDQIMKYRTDRQGTPSYDPYGYNRLPGIPLSNSNKRI